MKRNFFVHPFNLKYIDETITTQNYIYPTGINLDLVKYTVSKYFDPAMPSQTFGQNVTYEDINCALSNSIDISTRFTVFRSNNTTPVPTPWAYYTLAAVTLYKQKPYVETWLKKDKNPSRYYLTQMTEGSMVNIGGVYRFVCIFNLKYENITPFDTFRIGIEYGVSLPIDISGNLSDGTTSLSRNDASAFSPFTVNTYWKN